MIINLENKYKDIFSIVIGVVLIAIALISISLQTEFEYSSLFPVAVGGYFVYSVWSNRLVRVALEKDRKLLSLYVGAPLNSKKIKLEEVLLDDLKGVSYSKFFNRYRLSFTDRSIDLKNSKKVRDLISMIDETGTL